MPQVIIREVEPAVLHRLRERARQHGRSLTEELRLILHEAAAGPSPAIARVERVRARLGGRAFPDSSALVREDRDR